MQIVSCLSQVLRSITIKYLVPEKIAILLLLNGEFTLNLYFFSQPTQLILDHLILLPFRLLLLTSFIFWITQFWISIVFFIHIIISRQYITILIIIIVITRILRFISSILPIFLFSGRELLVPDLFSPPSRRVCTFSIFVAELY